MDSNRIQREINKDVTEKYPSIRRLNKILQNNICVKEEIWRETTTKSFQLNETENVIYLNSWDTVAAVLRGKYKVLNAHVRKKKGSKVNNLNFHIRTEKDDKFKPKVIEKKKAITNVVAEPNKIKTGQQ